MDRLILLRHGKAEVDSASGRDFDRALTGRGRGRAGRGQGAGPGGIRPDLVLVSPAARAAQTWEAMAEMFPTPGWKRARNSTRSAPTPSWPGRSEARSEGREARTVMVVGHNPGLGQLAAWLAQDAPAGDGRTRIVDGLPTAAAAVIGFEPPAFDLYTPGRSETASEPHLQDPAARRLGRGGGPGPLRRFAHRPSGRLYPLLHRRAGPGDRRQALRRPAGPGGRRVRHRRSRSRPALGALRAGGSCSPICTAASIRPWRGA